MAKLPVKQAADLAQAMSKHGLSGSIMMGKKMPAPMVDDESSEEKSDPSEDVCADLAKELSDGDTAKEARIHQLLLEFKDYLQNQDEEQDDGDDNSPGY